MKIKKIAVIGAGVMGNGLRWLRKIGNVSIGDTVVIVGPGLQGIAATAVAKESGAGPIIVAGLSRDINRLEMARRFGADAVIDIEAEDPAKIVAELTGGKMADVLMDVSGNPVGANLALSLAGKKATVVLPGLYKEPAVPLNLNHAVVNELKLLGVFSHDFRAVKPALRMVRENRYPFDELISHEFPLEDAEHALRLVAGKIPGETSLKVLLNPEKRKDAG